MSPEGVLLNVWHCPGPTTSMLQTLFAENGAIAGGCSAVMVRRELEYNYDRWAGSPNTDTDVSTLIPGGATGGEHAVLTYPRGEEVVIGQTPISWFVWGSQIQWTSIDFSTDGGRTWSTIQTYLPTQQGWNSHTEYLTNVTSKARVKIRCYSSSLEYIAGDGSQKNFFVQAKPDLIAVPGPTGFCQTNAQGQLVVKVKNQGAASAGASVTRVVFSPMGTFCLNTPAIGVGETVEVAVDRPSSCWDPDCNFEITVDSNNQVDEANEGNNVASGIWDIE